MERTVLHFVIISILPTTWITFTELHTQPLSQRNSNSKQLYTIVASQMSIQLFVSLYCYPILLFIWLTYHFYYFNYMADIQGSPNPLLSINCITVYIQLKLVSENSRPINLPDDGHNQQTAYFAMTLVRIYPPPGFVRGLFLVSLHVTECYTTHNIY